MYIIQHIADPLLLWPMLPKSFKTSVWSRNVSIWESLCIYICVDSERSTLFFNKSRSSLLLFLLGVQVPKQNFNGGKMILAFKLELEVKVLKKNIGTPTSSFQFGQQKFQKLIVNSTSALILEPKESVADITDV